MSSEPVFCVLLNVSNKLYLMMTEGTPSEIIAFATEIEASEYFTTGYNVCHERSYQSSMSACIHFVQFGPRVVRVMSIDDLKLHIIEPFQLTALRTMAGRMVGLALKESARPLYEGGVTPKLITPKESA